MSCSVRRPLHSMIISGRCIASSASSTKPLHHHVKKPLPFCVYNRLQSSTSNGSIKRGGSYHHASLSDTSPKPQSIMRIKSSSKSTSSLNAPPSQGRDDASLARYPNLHSPGGVLRGLDYAGTITFALTGSVTAAQSGLDVFGCAMAAVITAVGGGTIRDAIFLNRKPFWTEETEYIWMGLCTGLITFFAWPTVLEWQKEHKKEIINGRRIEEQIAQSTVPSDGKRTTQKDEIDASYEANNLDDCYDELDGALDTLDAIGLSAFAIIGAQNGVRAGMPMLVSAICGMATSTFGGLTRDVLCGRPVRIVHSNAEVYAPPALVGATAYLAVKKWGANPGVRIGLAMAMCMGSRFVAVKNDVKLHTWDTSQDNLGVAVRKRPTVKKH